MQLRAFVNRSRTFLTAFSIAMLAAGASAQTWKPLAHQPPINAYNPTLLTDGTVLVQDADNSNWWKLIPDNKGSYINGTWKQLKSTPGYGPLYYASQVLPDGRFLALGGEYSFGNLVWMNKGSMYDPQTDTWTTFAAPPGWAQIGDMGSIMLADGTVLFAHPLSSQLALYNPVTNILTAPYSTGKADGNDEEGLTMLPNGKVLVVDVGVAQGSEIFDPATKKWTSAGKVPQVLVGDGSELGPQVLMYDGKVICFGGSVHNCIYDSKTGVWSSAPDYPNIGGALDCADAPACLLPNGKVLVQTSPGLFNPPSVFLEFDGKTFTKVPAPPNAPFEPSFVGNMLTLPTGEILFTDQSPDVEVYQPGGTTVAGVAPTITSAPSLIKAGATYTISGTQFNGLSGCSAYGDDQQNATNYPLIRITNKASGHVFYCREFNPSTMAICTGSTIVSTNFTVPLDIELGPATIQVVTNGIASAPVNTSTAPTAQAAAVSLFTGTAPSGVVKNIWTTGDGLVFSGTSVSTSAGQVAAVEADFTIPSSSISNLTFITSAAAKSNATAFCYLYDWSTKQFVLVGKSAPYGTGQTFLTTSGTVPVGRFVGPGNAVKFIVRSVVPTRFPGTYKFSVDSIQIAAQ